MKAKLKFIGTNYVLEHLRDKEIMAEIQFVGNAPPYDNTNMHLVFDGVDNYFFDVKGAKVGNNVILEGILNDGENIGRAAIEIIYE